MTKTPAKTVKKAPIAQKTGKTGAPKSLEGRLSASVAAPKRVIDWDGIAVPYRAGIRSLMDIGQQYGVSDAAIIKHAKKNGWTRDLKGKIKAKADAKVSAAMVSAEVSALTKITEAITVDVESTVIARIRLSHRKDIGRSREVANSLLGELESQTKQVPELARLGELMASPDKNGIDKLNELYQKIISLPSRTKTMKELADTLKTLIGLEREAYGLATVVAPPTDSTYESNLDLA